MEPLEKEIRDLMSADPPTLGTFCLGMQPPVNYLSWMEPMLGFLIASAREVLDNPLYAAWFLRYSSTIHRRPVILDASAMESAEDMYAAMIGITPMGVIAPYFADDLERSKHMICTVNEQFKDDVGIIGLCGGATIDDHVKLYRHYVAHGVSMIGFPDTPLRLDVIRALSDLHLLEHYHVHFLYGCSYTPILSDLASLGYYQWYVYTNTPMLSVLDSFDVLADVQRIVLDRPLKLNAKFTLTDEQLYDLTVGITKFQALLPSSDDDDDFDDDDDEEDDDE